MPKWKHEAKSARADRPPGPNRCRGLDAATEKSRRLWNRDKTLWTGADEDKWLGWLDIADRQLAQRKRFTDLAASVKSKGYKDAVLLGMGGSSLCPEVLSLTFGQQEGFPELHILDSTDPAQVKAIETIADPKTSLYIVSSKSGSTLEPNIFKDYFFDKSGRDGSRFIAITDPGSKMQSRCRAGSLQSHLLRRCLDRRPLFRAL